MQKCEEYWRGLASIVYKFSDEKSSGGAVMQNQQLAEELHKPIIRKLEKRKVYSSLKGNIWGADLADMPSISQYKRSSFFIVWYWYS